MDAMDYTMEGMDDGQQNHAPQCQTANISSQTHFSPSPFDYPAFHYDPVHNGYVSQSISTSQNPDRRAPENIWGGYNDASARNRGGADAYIGSRTTSTPSWETGDYIAPSNDFNTTFGYASNYLPPYIRGNGQRNTTAQTPLNNASNTRSSQRYSNSYDIHNNRSFQASQEQSNSHYHIPNGQSRHSRTAREDIRPVLQPPMSRSYENFPPQNPVSLAPSRRRRSEWESDEDDEDSLLDEREERRISMSIMDGERGMALLRAARDGQKRVVSQAYIDELEKLDVANLDKDEKTCTICYNDLGVENPDGLTEHPVRLPKCQHIFGDACIKKWFTDADHCPYCRDKLPSQTVSRGKGSAALAARFLQERRLGITGAAGSQLDRREYLASYIASEDQLIMQERINQHSGISAPYAPPQWSSPPGNRASVRDAARRQARGRLQARPTSIGGTRVLPAAPPYRPYNPTPYYPPGLQRHSSDRTSDSTANQPPAQQLPNPPLFSPPVAVGSGVPSNDTHSSQSRRGPQSTFDFPVPSGSMPIQNEPPSAAIADSATYGDHRREVIQRQLASLRENMRSVENMYPNRTSENETFSPSQI